MTGCVLNFAFSAQLSYAPDKSLAKNHIHCLHILPCGLNLDISYSPTLPGEFVFPCFAFISTTFCVFYHFPPLHWIKYKVGVWFFVAYLHDFLSHITELLGCGLLTLLWPKIAILVADLLTF